MQCEVRRERLAALTGGKDCVFVDAKGSPEAAVAAVESALLTLVPALGFSPSADAQILSPGNQGLLGGRQLNERLRPLLNPHFTPAPVVTETGDHSTTDGPPLPWGRGDKVIQTVNNYDKEVYNGDVGIVTSLEHHATATVEFVVGKKRREVKYQGKKELRQLLPAWAITVHKSQGSEYEVVIVPVTMMHSFINSRNLLYTALTRSQALCIVVGDRRAVHMALAKTDGGGRWTGLRQHLLARSGK